MEILNVSNLSFKYQLGTAPAIHDVSFSVNAGDFTVICGSTGSGKSTLLRMLKRELTPIGDMTGQVTLDGVPIDMLDDRTAASSVGFVMQRPEQQLVTDKVWHELAFGLENLGTPQNVIRRRVSEMAAYFGIEGWFEKRTDELSGGQKQLLNLASVMVMQPRILILDEPTAQLDPIAASDFLETVGKLNRDMGLTVLLVEHRLEEAVPRCDRLLVMSKGTLLLYDEPRTVCARLREHPALLEAMPAAVRLHNECPAGECPLTVREGRRWIGEHYSGNYRTLPEITAEEHGAAALEMHDVWLRYQKDMPDVLRGTELKVYEGEIFCLLGRPFGEKLERVKLKYGV